MGNVIPLRKSEDYGDTERWEGELAKKVPRELVLVLRGIDEKLNRLHRTISREKQENHYEHIAIRKLIAQLSSGLRDLHKRVSKLELEELEENINGDMDDLQDDPLMFKSVITPEGYGMVTGRADDEYQVALDGDPPDEPQWFRESQIDILKILEEEQEDDE